MDHEYEKLQAEHERITREAQASLDALRAEMAASQAPMPGVNIDAAHDQADAFAEQAEELNKAMDEAVQATANNDRELLKFAAKAASYPIHSDAWACGPGGATPSLYMGSNGPLWNPLADDGDALRLAVKLRITPHIDGNLTDAESAAGFFTEPHFADPYAATRRAIVRAAAEIGRAA